MGIKSNDFSIRAIFPPPILTIVLANPYLQMLSCLSHMVPANGIEQLVILLQGPLGQGGYVLLFIHREQRYKINSYNTKKN